MNELISISTGGQGSPVVSARELYMFLEVKSRFADWFKNRVVKYGFVEGQEFVALSKNLDNGGRELDYALTLDMAKELSMVERNEKGKQARQYFIEAEKALRQIVEAPAPVVLTPAQQLLQQAQVLVSHEDRIGKLEKSLSALVEREQHRLELPPPTLRPMPVDTTRQKVVQMVNQLAELNSTEYYRIWNQVYTRLHTLYGFNVRAKAKSNFENLIDVCERHGQMDRLFAIVSAELNVPDEEH